VNDGARPFLKPSGFLRGEPPAVLLIVGVLMVGAGFGMESAARLAFEMIPSETNLPLFGTTWHLCATLRMLNNLLNVIGIGLICFATARVVANAAPSLVRRGGKAEPPRAA
jgi:hypothetical protein